MGSLVDFKSTSKTVSRITLDENGYSQKITNPMLNWVESVHTYKDISQLMRWAGKTNYSEKALRLSELRKHSTFQGRCNGRCNTVDKLIFMQMYSLSGFNAATSQLVRDHRWYRSLTYLVMLLKEEKLIFPSWSRKEEVHASPRFYYYTNEKFLETQ